MKLRSSKEVSWVSKPGLFNLGFTMRQIFQYQYSSYLEEFSELGGEMVISKTETYAPASGFGAIRTLFTPEILDLSTLSGGHRTGVCVWGGVD